jgi:hypothetical protein
MKLAGAHFFVKGWELLEETKKIASIYIPYKFLKEFGNKLPKIICR